MSFFSTTESSNLSDRFNQIKDEPIFTIRVPQSAKATSRVKTKLCNIETSFIFNESVSAIIFIRVGDVHEIIVKE
jgi:hypothetical protein